jgi:hypothetical protein
LKGGTALNLFRFEVPRLSVDIDLNYVGAVDRETMLAERPKVEEAIRAVCAREGFAIRRLPQEHAGGKWTLRYESVWARTFCQDSLCMIIHGVWRGLCTFGQEVEGLEAAAPTKWGRAALLNL